MAVDEPCSGVVKLERDGEVAVTRESSNVTTRGVRQVEQRGVAMEHAGVLGEHEEVVAVEMDGVVDGKASVIFYDENNKLRSRDTGGPVHVDDVVVEGEGGLAVHHSHECGVLPVNLETAAVEGPLEPGAAGRKAHTLCGNLVDDTHVQGQMRNQIRHGLVSTALGLGDGADSGRVGSARAVVAHDSSNTVWVEVVAAGSVPLCTQPVVSRSCIGLDNYIVALAHANAHGFCSIGDERNEIVANDGEIVVVDGELEVGVGSRVHNPETVLLASLEYSLPFRSSAQALDVVSRSGAVVGVRAVDQAVLHDGRAANLCGVPQGKCFSVAPVAEEHHAKVLIIVRRGWTIQDQAAESTLSVLQREMAVIPGGAVLGGLELVRLRATRRDGALSDTRHTVRVGAVELPHAVPMDSSTVGLEVVGDVNLEVVTPVGLGEIVSYLFMGKVRMCILGITHSNRGTRNSPVERHASPLIPIRRAVNGVKSQPVLAGDASVGDLLVVVGVDRVVAPAATRSGTVLACCVLTRPESKFAQIWVQTNNIG